MGECTNYVYGSITLASASEWMTISGLGFVPTHILVWLATNYDATMEYRSIAANSISNKSIYTNNDSDGFVVGLSSSTKYPQVVKFGETTTISPANIRNGTSYYWEATTYAYFAWREE